MCFAQTSPRVGPAQGRDRYGRGHKNFDISFITVRLYLTKILILFLRLQGKPLQLQGKCLQVLYKTSNEFRVEPPRTS